MRRPRPITYLMRLSSEDATPEQLADDNGVYICDGETVASKTLRSTDRGGLEVLKRVCNLNIGFSALFMAGGIAMAKHKLPIGNVEVAGGLPGEIIEKSLEYGPSMAVISMSALIIAEFVEIRNATMQRIHKLST